MIPDIKCYILNSVPSKPALLKPVVTLVAINHQMAMIQVQVMKNFIEYVLLSGGSRVNIITKKLKMQLGLSKPKPTPYNLHMANQTNVKPLGLIKELNFFVHGILYTTTFIVI